MMRKFYLILFFTLHLVTFSQRGKDGSVTISTNNSVVNIYTALTQNSSVGNKTITVQSSSMYTLGDLVFIIQMQGAVVNAGKDTIYPDINSSIPTNTSFGSVTNYYNSGKNEYAQISAVPNSTTIILDCGLKNSYDYLAKVQVIKVPRYLDLTISGVGSITCPAWNGSTGGIALIEVKNNCLLNSTPSFSVTGKGFRGGAKENSTGYGGNKFGSLLATEGAFKGESVAGDTTRYKIYSATFGRGAIANGGGGGCNHNAGGGGGANGGNVLAYDGFGNPASGYNTSWNLESASFSSHTSSGGGRGGYTFTSANINPLTTGPGSGAGDARRNMGGFGGRPLDYSTGRLFLAGGGGAGDGGDNKAGAGGNGGGMVYIVCYGNLLGSGTIVADGANGLNTTLTCSGNDGAGGGGGGGTIVLNVSGIINLTSTTALSAKGGDGGNVNYSTLCFNTDSYGPGAGGSGGYISTSGTIPANNISGGLNGILIGNSANIATSFPPNGATKGGVGSIGNNLMYSLTTTGNQTVCINQPFILTATSLEPSNTIMWYNNLIGGTAIATGTAYASSGYPSAGSYTLFAGICPGTYRQPIVITVGSSLNISVNTPSICAGQTATLIASGAMSYTWSNGSTTNNIVYSPTATTVFTVIGTSSLCSGVKTASIIVNNSPTISLISPTVCSASQATINVSGAGSLTVNPTPTSIFGSVIIFPAFSSNTSFTVSGSNGFCTSSTSGNIFVNATPTITVNSASLCSGESATLVANGGVSYLWDNGATTSTLITAPLSSTIYTITGFNGICSASVIASVNVNTVTLNSYSVVIPTCANTTTTINAGASGATTYIWSNGVNTMNQVVNPTTSTTYTVVGYNGQCLALLGIITLSVNAILVDFTGINTTTVIQNSNLNLINTSIGANNYRWDFCDLTSSSLTNELYFTKDLGNCCIKLVGENSYCKDSVIKCFFITNELLVTIPNVITPNGDNRNDLFKISDIGLKSMHCSIFDRWGLKIYEWEGVNGYWDGNAKTGPAPSGTYFYILNYTRFDDKVINEKNFFHLFRD